jgi:type IV pilus assembly protein PilZ
MSEHQQGQGSLPLIFLDIPNLDVLAAHYLAFLDCGGVFIPGPSEHSLGNQVVVILTLAKPARRLAICSTVFLLMPGKPGRQNTGGTGLLFSGSDNEKVKVIDKLLAPLKGKRLFCQALSS